ncbi:MAG: pseudaminic acid synthase [Flavobacteriaceae bacterium]|jgi:pseudaminic acid synthase|nr:pseudaminic acid synthase [Flavobacteriaceae bacterium]
MKIESFDFSKNKETYIVAELSANHNQDFKTAIDTIKAAKEIGCNAVKIQTYTPDTITIDCNKKDFLIKGTIWGGDSLYSLYKKAYTPWEWHKELFDVAKKTGITLFSTPFDKSSVDFLEKLNTPAYKIASFEITDIPLIKYIAQKNKPIILSTGIAEKQDIDLAVSTILDQGNDKIILLQCTSSYPSPLDQANLKLIDQLKNDYNVVTGLSDHTLGHLCPVIAVSLGARFIEKHFILDKTLGGPDSSFSLDKNEFKIMIENIRNTEKALGEPSYSLTKKQIEGKYFSRSLYIVKDVKKGDLVTTENIKSIRPGYGLHPKHYDQVLNKNFTKDLDKGTRLSFKLIN